MKLIYENIKGEISWEKVAAEFDDVYKVKNFNWDIPEEGFFFGSIAGCNWMRQNRPNVKFFSTFENYQCSVYYPQVSNLLFNDKYAFVPFKELGRRKWDLYAWLGKESLIFVRPNSCEKDTPAQLVDLQDIDKFVDSYDYEGLAVVSTPKNMIGEWRFIIANEKVQCCSSYKYQGVLTCVPSAPRGATELADKIIQRGISPDPIFCLDIVQDMDNNFWVMELTSFSSAGLYANDPKIIAKLIKGKYAEYS